MPDLENYYLGRNLEFDFDFDSNFDTISDTEDCERINVSSHEQDFHQGVKTEDESATNEPYISEHWSQEEISISI